MLSNLCEGPLLIRRQTGRAERPSTLRLLRKRDRCIGLCQRVRWSFRFGVLLNHGHRLKARWLSLYRKVQHQRGRTRDWPRWHRMCRQRRDRWRCLLGGRRLWSFDGLRGRRRSCRKRCSGRKGRKARRWLLRCRRLGRGRCIFSNSTNCSVAQLYMRGRFLHLPERRHHPHDGRRLGSRRGRRNERRDGNGVGRR